MTDEQLLQEFAQGKKSSMAELRRRYFQPALEYVLRTYAGGDICRAAEVVWQTFAYVRVNATYRSKMGFRPWFFTVCMNLAKRSAV